MHILALGQMDFRKSTNKNARKPQCHSLYFFLQCFGFYYFFTLTLGFSCLLLTLQLRRKLLGYPTFMMKRAMEFLKLQAEKYEELFSKYEDKYFIFIWIRSSRFQDTVKYLKGKIVFQRDYGFWSQDLQPFRKIQVRVWSKLRSFYPFLELSSFKKYIEYFYTSRTLWRNVVGYEAASWRYSGRAED